MMDHDTVKRISSLCAKVFLPCLIVVQMGPELTADNLSTLWILPVWGLVSTIIGHLLGWLAQAVLRTPSWVIVAAGRPNTSALPLLLLQSLETTGVLELLGADGESVSQTLHRAKSLILLNVVVQQAFTFQTAPSLLERDATKRARRDSAGDAEAGATDELSPAAKHASNIAPIVQDSEHVGLLQDNDARSYGSSSQAEPDYPSALEPIAEEPDIHWPRSIGIFEKPLKKIAMTMSPPLIGAIIGLILGIIPPLHELFYSEGSALYTAVTQSAKELGNLFVALQMFTVGAELALVPNCHPGYIPMGCALLVRFLIMPGLSLLFVWLTAGRGLYVDDKLVWFLLVLIPAGPSAMLLANVAELVNVDQGPIAGYLTVSYVFSPLMAVVCFLGLFVVDSASKRL
ncbi:hypothetical protein NM688_g1565 [Phlebia brevispora]|uniref:Uncharacterized protein n=1 Tax=Phlebia brevispora TaxID=194682 RepID=A0ACC1TBC2_9APHY|nr:hypothetical protein NM688_g1565 [Phlebia brevispora]